MNIKLYQIDAFTNKVFSGNPAAVCPLDNWLADEVLQNIAMENNLAETAYYVKENSGYRIRWFTPTVEVDLCGHATLATAHVLFNYEKYENNTIVFDSRSGKLAVSKSGEVLTLDFPKDIIAKTDLTPELMNAFNVKPTQAFKGKTDYMLIFENEDQIRTIKPDLKLIASLNCRGVMVTAPGKDADFVSRFFGPASGIDEDPVTGSAHTTLTPYWSLVLNKSVLKAFQLSPRGGQLTCELVNDRVKISGQARTFLTGAIEI
jgi:PhzF family phenazine biosynthesis protein